MQVCPTLSAALVQIESESRAVMVKAGDVVPDVSFDVNFPPKKLALKDVCKGNLVVVVGLPGAFTPT